ncbi:hypothetical protein H0G86_011765 [Trichoderma simmonsii]|uniref:Transmembrane protein n=1 Tax=Trichoderma simmonsii TaxID=1491479 RepID=A0A8G0LQ25_9HYPO|nr:hypothetical protein H0G86_011765 [Trichoderma simmonsii]
MRFQHDSRDKTRKTRLRTLLSIFPCFGHSGDSSNKFHIRTSRKQLKPAIGLLEYDRDDRHAGSKSSRERHREHSFVRPEVDESVAMPRFSLNCLFVFVFSALFLLFSALLLFPNFACYLSLATIARFAI